MDPLILARWQFAITTVYHFFFVPLTLGLAILVAVMETIYVSTGDETWKRMTKFWGKLFLINFAMGVATGIVQEFQFGMNWSEYSRFVGDIFGAPLAIEALLAFFMESTFLGIWIFGWDRLSKRLHVVTIWLVAVASNLSALWILIANSFMQQPLGYTINATTKRAEMVDFGALLTNPNVWVQWPHVFFSGLTTAGFFMLGITAYRLFRARRQPVAAPGKSSAAKRQAQTNTQSIDAFFRKSFQVATIAAVIGSILVILVGHTQAQHMVQVQPMKMAAAEALWDSENPASMSLFTIGDMKNRRDVFAIRVPALLSILSYNQPSGEVKGINQLQAEYTQKFGTDEYMPFTVLIYWAFRAMVGAGFLMAALALFALYRVLVGKAAPGWFLRWMLFAIALPYLANSTGWIMTEMGRQPWMVFGVLKTDVAVSPNVSGAMVLASVILFTLLYGVLMAADVYLLAKYAKADPAAVAADTVPAWSYSLPLAEDFMSLNTLWFILIGVLFTGFFFLEGFDYGVGILLPFLGKKDEERRIVINTIGPFWDGNEVWLLTAGGAMFAAFPNWYATMFSGFYLALLLMLLALIVRGVAFEFRSKDEAPRWRAVWDWCIFGGSFVPALLWGVALANIVRGVPIDAKMQYVGGFFNLLNPYALLGGLTSLAAFTLHGAIFLSLRTEGDLLARAQAAARRLWLPTVIIVFALVITTYFATDIYKRLGVNPGISAIGSGVALLIAGWFIRNKRYGWAFAMNGLTIALTVITTFRGLYPRVMVSSLNPDWSLTITNASSSPYTLRIMSIVALIFVPIVLAYQAWNYWVFRARVSGKQALKY